MNPVQQLLTENIGLWTGADTAKKSGRGRASGSAGTVYGIKKLRELILEFAVRGKLVPQDANDESAGVLLERIREEKARLVPDGKIKKSNSIAEIASDEKTFALPQQWEWVRFGAIYSLEYGDNLPAGKRSNSGEYPVYGSNGIVGSHNISFVKSPCIVVGRKGSAGALNLSLCAGCCVTDVAYYCIPPKCLDLIFSFKLFHSLGLDHLGKGIKPGLNRNDVYELLIAIPPIAEQHRIVAKVDELMALCDQLEAGHVDAVDAHEKLVSHLLATLTASQDSTDFSASWQRIAAHFDMLFTTEASIDALKQTLLQLAVMGKLVPQDSNDEPASVMLKRYEVSSIKATSSGWCHVPLGKLGVVYGGATPSKAKHEYWAGTIPWVSPKDMKRFYIDDAEDSVSENAVSETSLKIIPPGSLLMVVRGMILAHSFPVALTTCEVTINQDMKALLIPDEIKEYMLLYLRAMKHVFVGLVDRSSHGTCKIISEKLWAASVTIPPKKEQDRIAAKVDELMALCDRMKKRIADAGALQRKLADVIVAQAIA